MTRYTSLLFIILLFILNNLWAQQNLFDCNNSRRFANYLFNTGQYDLSQQELERIGFFCEMDSSSQLLLIKSYRKLKKYNEGNLFFMGKSVTDLGKLNPDFRMEYIRLLMAQQNYRQVQLAIEQGLDFSQKKEHELGTYLLLKEWEKAYEISHPPMANLNLKMAGLTQIAEKSFAEKRKKPWVSTLLSLVVPGSGKMYSGYWGDGAISFLFTASSSFFAYRAFQKYGPNKVYPWIVGGLAVSYYSANIYGGHRAAVRYNENLDHGFLHETEEILYSDY